MATQIFFCSLLASTFFVALAFDHNPLQDLCVADLKSSVRVNGMACKHPKAVTVNDFFFSGLHEPGNLSIPVGLNAKLVMVPQIPGLNTLGITMVRLDYAPSGANPPHIHPRGTEILTVLEGTLEAGFLTTNPEYKHFSKTLHKGDVFVFPVGLVHFERNLGPGAATVIMAFNSQNPGLITIANSVFGSTPAISADLLAKSFKMDKKIVTKLQSKF